MRPENPNKLDPMKLALMVFESAMAVLYVCVGVMFLFTRFLEGRIDNGLRIALGIVVGFYGIFRVYRAVKKLRS